MSEQHNEATVVVFIDNRSPFFIEVKGKKYPISLTVRSGATKEEALEMINVIGATIAEMAA